MPDSPEMPVLVAQLPLDVENVVTSRAGPDSPPVLSDGEGSEQSCGNSDSGKENDEEERERHWRPGKTENSQTKLPLQESQPAAAGRITRSASGKVPLSLKSCENLQNEFNIADGGATVTIASSANSATNSANSSSNKEIPSPPTPHKIIKMKEPGLCAQSLNKLKSISLTPKKSTKTTKQSKK